MVPIQKRKQRNFLPLGISLAIKSLGRQSSYLLIGCKCCEQRNQVGLQIINFYDFCKLSEFPSDRTTYHWGVVTTKITKISTHQNRDGIQILQLNHDKVSKETPENHSMKISISKTKTIIKFSIISSCHQKPISIS